jgi:hypothetical protein
MEYGSADGAHRTPEQMASELTRRGHVVTSWDELGSVTLPVTGVETSQYRIGPPDDESSPTVFKAYFPPGCRVEAHTHGCNYSEIVLEGSQQVSGRWLHAGDIRVGLADRAYGPLIAGPEGVTVLVIFADGNWPAITVGAGDGSTLGTEQLMERFTSA